MTLTIPLILLLLQLLLLIIIIIIISTYPIYLIFGTLKVETQQGESDSYITAVRCFQEKPLSFVSMSGRYSQNHRQAADRKLGLVLRSPKLKITKSSVTVTQTARRVFLGHPLSMSCM